MLPPRHLDTGAGESTGAALARATRRGRRCSLVRLLPPLSSRHIYIIIKSPRSTGQSPGQKGFELIAIVSAEAGQHPQKKTTPVGFEPTRGDPIGLAGRRLSRSAKVSSAKREDAMIVAQRAVSQHAVGVKGNRRNQFLSKSYNCRLSRIGLRAACCATKIRPPGIEPGTI